MWITFTPTRRQTALKRLWITPILLWITFILRGSRVLMAKRITTAEERNKHDWRKSPSGRYPYTGDIENKRYLKDRSELFAKSGNGWWWYQGTPQGQFIGIDNEEG